MYFFSVRNHFIKHSLNSMLTLIFLLLSTYEVARGSLKTYCLKSNNECDDTWRPKDLDNIDAALVGYDLPSGNLEFCVVVYYYYYF